MPVCEWVVDVLRAGYGLDGDEDTWLASVATALWDGLGVSHGALSCFFHACARGIHPFGIVMNGSSPEHLNAFLHACAHTANPLGHHEGPTEDGTMRLPSHGPILLANKTWGLFAADSPSTGCAFLFFDMSLPSHILDRWDSVATHVGNGLRFRRQHPELFAAPGRDLAWQQLAIQLDRTPGMTQSADPACSLWKGLMTGQWFLLLHRAHQGRRYVVARRADPGLAALLALTPREAQAISLAVDIHYPDHQSIAHAMGSTESTVATHLAHAMKKLGVHSRAELLAIKRNLPDK